MLSIKVLYSAIFHYRELYILLKTTFLAFCYFFHGDCSLSGLCAPENSIPPSDYPRGLGQTHTAQETGCHFHKIKNATSENNLHALVVKHTIYVHMLSKRLGYNGCRNFYANICNSVTANLAVKTSATCWILLFVLLIVVLIFLFYMLCIFSSVCNCTFFALTSIILQHNGSMVCMHIDWNA